MNSLVAYHAPGTFRYCANKGNAREVPGTFGAF